MALIEKKQHLFLASISVHSPLLILKEPDLQTVRPHSMKSKTVELAWGMEPRLW